jgi:4-amino-4-deoxy-L-arabinose transferase-like glycosyltransferase
MANDRSRTLVLVVALCVAGALLRLDGIAAPPLDFEPARQYQGALLAREMYLKGKGDQPPWQRRVVDAIHEQVDVIEPPVLEAMAVVGYRLTGGERLWIPRTISVLAWTVGALLLYLVARRVAEPPGSLIAAAVFLFAPYAVVASRSFQPDPLMVTAIVASLLTALRYDEHPTRRRLAAALVAVAVALVLKPGLSAPFVVIPFLALLVRRVGVRRLLSTPAAWLVGLAAVPMLAYVIYGTYVAGFLRENEGDQLRPSLLLKWRFWTYWRLQVSDVLTYPWTAEFVAVVITVAVAAGIVLARPGRPRTLLTSFFLAYLVFGLIFTVHISTHPYYSLPLIPMVALALGSLADVALTRLPDWRGALRIGVATGGAIVAACLVAVALHDRLSSPQYARRAALYKRIGDAAGHPTKALWVDRLFGLPVAYHGWMVGQELLTGFETQRAAARALDTAQRLAASGQASCIITTDTVSLARIPQFAREVRQRFHLVREGPNFTIFELRPDEVTRRCS